jgi:hypothetical protein
MKQQPGPPPPLNRAGRAYVIGSVVLATVVILVILAFISGLWRGSLFWMPSALIVYAEGMFRTQPLYASIGAALAAIVIGGSAYLANRRVAKVETFVGEPKSDVTVATGVLLLLGDVTKGVVITILELISD